MIISREPVIITSSAVFFVNQYWTQLPLQCNVSRRFLVKICFIDKIEPFPKGLNVYYIIFFAKGQPCDNNFKIKILKSSFKLN